MRCRLVVVVFCSRGARGRAGAGPAGHSAAPTSARSSSTAGRQSTLGPSWPHPEGCASGSDRRCGRVPGGILIGPGGLVYQAFRGVSSSCARSRPSSLLPFLADLGQGCRAGLPRRFAGRGPSDARSTASHDVDPVATDTHGLSSSFAFSSVGARSRCYPVLARGVRSRRRSPPPRVRLRSSRAPDSVAIKSCAPFRRRSTMYRYRCDGAPRLALNVLSSRRAARFMAPSQRQAVARLTAAGPPDRAAWRRCPRRLDRAWRLLARARYYSRPSPTSCPRSQTHALSRLGTDVIRPTRYPPLWVAVGSLSGSARSVSRALNRPPIRRRFAGDPAAGPAPIRNRRSPRRRTISASSCVVCCGLLIRRRVTGVEPAHNRTCRDPARERLLRIVLPPPAPIFAGATAVAGDIDGHQLVVATPTHGYYPAFAANVATEIGPDHPLGSWDFLNAGSSASNARASLAPGGASERLEDDASKSG